MGKFVIKQAKTGPMFNLKASNGEVIATSQIYASRRTCLAGIESVRVNAPIAPVEDQTVEGFQKLPNPKFEIYTDKKGEFRYRLKAKNGQIIISGEGYAALKNCKSGIASVKKNAEKAKIEDEE